MTNSSLSAPAKINLDLRILRKREDGFHEIDTLMMPVALHDELRLTQRSSGGLAFSCNQPDLETADNLVVQALRALEAAMGHALDLAVHLEKRIPSGAGLGGGSSDAAAVLRGARDLFELPLEDSRLEVIGAELGSDVPFFIRGQAARCRGRGEQIEHVHFPWKIRPLLLKPAFGIPTPWAYRHWQASTEIAGIPYTPQPMPWGEIFNDLERPVFAKHLVLGEMKRWLLDQPEVEAAGMSGSGSTMFALLEERAEARSLEKRALTRYGDHLWTHF